MKIAVLGATGFIGRALVPALAEQAEVLAISRRGDATESMHVRAVAADAADEVAIGRALEGVDVAYYLVHSLGKSDFGGLDRRAAATGTTSRSICAAARRPPPSSRAAVPSPSRFCEPPSSSAAAAPASRPSSHWSIACR